VPETDEFYERVAARLENAQLEFLEENRKEIG